MRIIYQTLYYILYMQGQLSCDCHKQQPLDLLCLDPNCPKRGLICFLCKIEDHQAHKPIVSLRLFLSNLLSTRSQHQYFVRQTSLIDQQLIALQQTLLKLRTKFLDYSIVQESYQNFWKGTVTEIIAFDSVIAELESLVTRKTDQQKKKLNAWIEKHSNMFNIEREENVKDSVYIAFLKSKLSNLKSIADHMNRIQEKGIFDDSDILLLFKVETEDASKLRLHFSQELKGECMSILSPTRASMTTSGSQRMLLLEPALSNSRSNKRWKVKIQKLASWIGIGVGHLDSIKAGNFDFNYTITNHGNYLISSNGYSWNGFKMEYNSKFQSFTFTTGDVVEIIYDPNNNNMTLTKESTSQSFTYDIDPNQKPIHAAINLTGIGDAVEIIQ